MPAADGPAPAGGAPGRRIRVVVADDEPLVREGLSMILESEADLDVLGGAGDGAGLLELVRRLRPDVAVVDLRMPVLDGVAVTRVLAADDSGGQGPEAVRVLVLSSFNDDEAVVAALRAGASGYLLKSAPTEHVVTAVRTVAGGGTWLDPAVAGHVLRELRSQPRQPPPGEHTPLPELTPREREVLVLLAQGCGTADITTRLTVSEATAKTHIARVLLKLGARDRAQAVAIAFHSGLVRPGERPAPARRP
ncbi:response regulator transcription factor [Kineococcus sp. NUM-3379]